MQVKSKTNISILIAIQQPNGHLKKNESNKCI